MVKKIAIISLSRGIIGEPFVRHEVKIGLKRLQEMGLEVVFTEHALKGLEYIEKHPQSRARDLLNALQDKSIDMILCAIGGEDTYKLAPYLFDNNELSNAINNKIFLGYSDTTWNHFMFNKLGLRTFYGQSFLSDICELDKEMLPYTFQYFKELIETGKISKIVPSNIWYEQREDFGETAIGTPLKKHINNGFELLQGPAVFNGKIFGGCLDSIYDMFDNKRFSDTVEITQRYGLFPDSKWWKGKILLLETSEEKMSTDKFRAALGYLKNAGVFYSVNGILFGKSVDEYNFAEYKKILVDEVADTSLPIVANINIGHALPRCIIPFGVDAKVDADNQVILFDC